MTIVNLSLTKRSLIAPAIGLISSFIIFVGFIYAVSSIEHQNERVFAVNEASRQIEKILLDARGGTSAFIQTVSFVGAKMEAKRIKQAQQQFSESFEGIEKNLEQIDFQGSGASAEAKDDIKKSLNSFLKGAKDVLGLLDIDVALANMQMLDTLNQAAVLDAKLESVRNTVEDNRAKIESASKHETNNILISILSLVVVIGLTALGVGIAMARNITSPIIKLTDVVTSLADGDLDVNIPYTDRKDEIGDVVRAVAIFQEHAVQTRAFRKQQENAAKHAEDDKKTLLGKMADRFENDIMGIVKTIFSSSTEMQKIAENMASSSRQLSQEAASVSETSTHTAANVDTVAAAAEELTASIGAVTGQVSTSATVVCTAGNDIHLTRKMISDLATASEQIGSVVQLISDIASQTNLLALNATIEAARAGDAGKGFSVVASEVKALANQTTKATQDIGDQISQIQNKTKNAVDATQNIEKTIDEVQNISSLIGAAVEQQGAATREIAQNVMQAAQGTRAVSDSIDGVSKIAATMETIASTVLTFADNLARNAGALQTGVNGFLATVRE